MYTIPSRRAYVEISIMLYGMPLLSLFEHVNWVCGVQNVANTGVSLLCKNPGARSKATGTVQGPPGVSLE